MCGPVARVKNRSTGSLFQVDGFLMRYRRITVIRKKKNRVEKITAEKRDKTVRKTEKYHLEKQKKILLGKQEEKHNYLENRAFIF